MIYDAKASGFVVIFSRRVGGPSSGALMSLCPKPSTKALHSVPVPFPALTAYRLRFFSLIILKSENRVRMLRGNNVHSSYDGSDSKMDLL